MKATVSRVDNHGDAKCQQANQVACINPFEKADPPDPTADGCTRILKNRNIQNQRLEDQATRLELGDQVENHKKNNLQVAENLYKKILLTKILDEVLVTKI